MKKSRWFSILTLFCASSAYAGQSGFYYKVQPDDPMRSATEEYYTGAQKKFSAPAMLEPTQSWPSAVHIVLQNPPDYNPSIQLWTEVVFAAPNGAQLAQGVYDQAGTRFSTTQPMLYASGSCPGAIGSFDVKEIEYDLEKHEVARFAADYVQRCESSASTTHGYIRYNSDVPLPQGPQLPLAIGSDTDLNNAGCFEATSMAGRRIELQAVNGASWYTYQWSGQVEARPNYSDCEYIGSCGGTIPAPPVLPGITGSAAPTSSAGLTSVGNTPSILRYLAGTDEALAFDLARVISEQAKVILTATDSRTGRIQKAYLTACVSDTTKPTITIRSPRDGDQIVGRNFIVDVSVDDNIDPSPYYYAKLGIYAFQFEANKPTRIMVPEPLLGKGEPLDLTFTVKAKDASFNWAEESVNVTVQHDMRK